MGEYAPCAHTSKLAVYLQQWAVIRIYMYLSGPPIPSIKPTVVKQYLLRVTATTYPKHHVFASPGSKNVLYGICHPQSLSGIASADYS
jgi:hypothetical protein